MLAFFRGDTRKKSTSFYNVAKQLKRKKVVAWQAQKYFPKRWQMLTNVCEPPLCTECSCVHSDVNLVLINFK